MGIKCNSNAIHQATLIMQLTVIIFLICWQFAPEQLDSFDQQTVWENGSPSSDWEECPSLCSDSRWSAIDQTDAFSRPKGSNDVRPETNSLESLYSSSYKAHNSIGYLHSLGRSGQVNWMGPSLDEIMGFNIPSISGALQLIWVIDWEYRAGQW
jgi:hypothetical protein